MPSYRIAVVGKPKVGVSSLISQYMGPDVNPENLPMQASIIKPDGNTLNLVEIKDDKNTPLQSYRGVQGIILAFDVNDPLALEQIGQSYKFLKAYNSDLPIIVTACKADENVPRVVSSNDMKNLCNRLGVDYCETSVASRTGVDEPFNFIYKAVHDKANQLDLPIAFSAKADQEIAKRVEQKIYEFINNPNKNPAYVNAKYFEAIKTEMEQANKITKHEIKNRLPEIRDKVVRELQYEMNRLRQELKDDPERREAFLKELDDYKKLPMFKVESSHQFGRFFNKLKEKGFVNTLDTIMDEVRKMDEGPRMDKG